MAYNETTLLNEILDFIRDLANYNAQNSSINDTKILSAGITRGVILKEGTFSNPVDESVMGFMANTTYRFVVEVYHAYGYDEEVFADLRADVKELRERLDGYHTVNGQAQSSRVIAGGKPEIGSLDGNGPFFIRRDLIYEVKILEAVTTL